MGLNSKYCPPMRSWQGVSSDSPVVDDIIDEIDDVEFLGEPDARYIETPAHEWDNLHACQDMYMHDDMYIHATHICSSQSHKPQIQNIHILIVHHQIGINSL